MKYFTYLSSVAKALQRITDDYRTLQKQYTRLKNIPEYSKILPKNFKEMAHQGETLKNWIDALPQFTKITDFMDFAEMGAGTLYGMINAESISPKNQRKFLERMQQKGIDATELQKQWNEPMHPAIALTPAQIQTVFDLLSQYREKEADWMKKEKSYIHIIENLTNGKTA